VKSAKAATRCSIGGPPAGIAAGMLLVALLLLLAPISAPAVEIAGSSNTYLQSRETVDGSSLLPLYEYLDLTVQDVGTESISVHFGGWLRFDLQDDSFGKEKNSDLQYGYVSYRRQTGNMAVKVGRVMVFEGVAAERVDGISAGTDLWYGFSISAFGGAPVETATGLPDNDVIYGGRISHRYGDLYTIGASYLKEDAESGNTFRQEGGIDLSIRPLNKVAVAGRSSYNFQTTGWMEHSYYLMLSPFDKLRVNLETTRINYADFFASVTTSALALTSTPGGKVDPKEKVDILGPVISYMINENWAVTADYRKYEYNIAGEASYYGASATYSKPKAYNAGVSLHKMDGDTKQLQYDTYRVYASKTMQKTDIVVDLVSVKYQEPINTVSTAYSASLACGYAFTEKLKAGADMEYAKNPDFDKDVRVLLKLNYLFDAGSGKRKGV
jgi:hypothetical protein